MDDNNKNDLIKIAIAMIVSGGGTHLANNVNLSQVVDECAPLVRRKAEIMNVTCDLRLIRCELGR